MCQDRNKIQNLRLNKKYVNYIKLINNLVF